MLSKKIITHYNETDQELELPYLEHSDNHLPGEDNKVTIQRNVKDMCLG